MTRIHPIDHVVTSLVISHDYIDVRRVGERRLRTVPGVTRAVLAGCCDAGPIEELIAAVLEAPELRAFTVQAIDAHITYHSSDDSGWPATFLVDLEVIEKGHA